MPTYALANDNLMLREPMAFRRPDCARLSPVTFCMLALARMVVQKIIAEKDRKADPLTKQKGLRGNTICFPQAVVKELVTSQLPADSETSRQFFSDSLCIVLAGCDPEDLDKATWAEVPRDAYVSAVRFLIAHSSAYHSLTLNEEDAFKRLAECGRSCQELLQQATPIKVSQTTKCKLDAPGDADAAEVIVGEAELGNSDAEAAPCMDWKVVQYIKIRHKVFRQRKGRGPACVVEVSFTLD